jgi:phosphonopyruvate decarboxylase
MMPSVEATRLIDQHRGDAVVVTTMSALRLWAQVSRRPDLDIPLTGAMGKASSLGLGLALARPDRRVIVLDGDGSLLMNLGSLVTVAHCQPANFYHFVYEDGAYTSTGGQPIPNAGRFSFADLAKGAGYRAAYEFHDLSDFAARIGDILAQPGPTLLCLKLKHSKEQGPMRWLTAERVRQTRTTLAEGGTGLASQ